MVCTYSIDPIQLLSCIEKNDGEKLQAYALVSEELPGFLGFEPDQIVPLILDVLLFTVTAGHTVQLLQGCGQENT